MKNTPWKLDLSDDHSAILDANGHQIASIPTWMEPDKEANAYLIAAAPDLLAACQMFLEDFAQPLGNSGLRVRIDTVGAMRDAIAKATAPAE